MDYKGKVVLITGGLGGIGMSTAKLYEKAGADVVIGDLMSKSTGAITKIDKEKSLYESKLNVSDEKNINALVEQIVEQFGHIDILINNAGICRPATPFEDLPIDSWRSMFEINTFGVAACTKAVIPYMKAQKYGKIIIVSSLASEVGGIRTEATYSASKAANTCMMMSLAKYLGPYNITVNGVAPGIIDTDMNTLLDEADNNIFPVEQIPLHRIGTGEDVGNVILFLTSNEADYLTGVMVDVNGGQHFR